MIRANHLCLEQALTLLDALDDAQYASRRGDWSPVGAQLRHVVEHYQSFVSGLPRRAIDYDARRRDVTIETSRPRAAAVIRELVAQLAAAGTMPTVGLWRTRSSRRASTRRGRATTRPQTAASSRR